MKNNRQITKITFMQIKIACKIYKNLLIYGKKYVMILLYLVNTKENTSVGHNKEPTPILSMAI